MCRWAHLMNKQIVCQVSAAGRRGRHLCMCAHVYTVYERTYIKKCACGGDPRQKGKQTRSASPRMTPGAGSWHCASVRMQEQHRHPAPRLSCDSWQHHSRLKRNPTARDAQKQDLTQSFFIHHSLGRNKDERKRFVTKKKKCSETSQRDGKDGGRRMKNLDRQEKMETIKEKRTVRTKTFSKRHKKRRGSMGCVNISGKRKMSDKRGSKELEKNWI